MTKVLRRLYHRCIPVAGTTHGILARILNLKFESLPSLKAPGGQLAGTPAAGPR